jgi:hypothetical protein
MNETRGGSDGLTIEQRRFLRRLSKKMDKRPRKLARTKKARDKK